MENIAVLQSLLNTEPPIIFGAITAILMAFSVVVGVALERFLTDQKLVDASGYEKKRREVFYWIVLTIMITLAVRFLVGSYIHLHITYTLALTPKTFLYFFKDLLFLFAFGAFLVRMAFSESCKDFLGWIIVFSLADVFWSGLQLIIGIFDLEVQKTSGPLALSWLGIGLCQLLIISICHRFVTTEKKSPRNFRIFVFLLIIFVVIFGCDLWAILMGSGWRHFSVPPLG
jgi:hypothetical protein